MMSINEIFISLTNAPFDEKKRHLIKKLNETQQDKESKRGKKERDTMMIEKARAHLVFYFSSFLLILFFLSFSTRVSVWFRQS